jgi:hypothetical protein
MIMIKTGGEMTATAIGKYTLQGFPAPKVIASEAQHEQYVSALLELERRKHLTLPERSYAELLTLLIESYEGSIIRFAGRRRLKCCGVW